MTASHSDDPDAPCRSDCTYRRCGDGIIDRTAAPAFPEGCESAVDCDGGSAYSVEWAVDSAGAGPNGMPVLSTALGADAGPAVVRVLVRPGITACEDADLAPTLAIALTTATATSTIENARQGGTAVVSLVGANRNMDVVLPAGLGTVDIAQVLRLDDD